MATSMPWISISNATCTLFASAENRRSGIVQALAFASAAFVFASPALATCALVADPHHAGARMLRCGAEVTAHLAKGTLVSPVGDAEAAPPKALRLDKGALLIEFQPQGSSEDFQILTPEAIAAVRGTQWAVEAERGKTSVFVVTGSVRVSARRGEAAVSLGPGDGVDVTRSAKDLEVKRWAQARVRRLLARFGQ